MSIDKIAISEPTILIGIKEDQVVVGITGARGADGTSVADVMTTRGDVIIRDATNVTARLGIGGADEVLTSDGTDVAWGAASGGAFQSDANSLITPITAPTLDEGTGNEVAYTFNYTVNKASSGNDTGMLIAMTDTASPGTSYPLNITVGAGSIFNLDLNGKLTLPTGTSAGLWFAGGTSSFYESAANTFRLTSNAASSGTSALEIYNDTSRVFYVTRSGSMYTTNIVYNTASGTVPGVMLNGDFDTGIGNVSGDIGALIAKGTEIIRFDGNAGGTTRITMPSATSTFEVKGAAAQSGDYLRVVTSADAEVFKITSSQAATFGGSVTVTGALALWTDIRPAQSGATLTLQGLTHTAADDVINAVATVTNDTGHINMFSITPTYNQDGGGADSSNTDLLINRTETAVGSGEQLLADFQVDTVSKFKVDNAGTLEMAERSSDPADPAEGKWTIWMSDGTGSGDDGDILIKVTAGATTKTVTLVDFSAV